MMKNKKILWSVLCVVVLAIAVVIAILLFGGRLRKTEILPEGLTEITFRDFEIEDKTYIGGTTAGQYDGKDLNNTLLCGKVTFSEEGQSFLMIGGKKPQGGFGLSTEEDAHTGETVLRLYDTNQDKSGVKFDEVYFHSDKAGVALVGTELDLKISIQYVDQDEDGMANDVKLGMWFGDNLYDNEYIYLKDYVDTEYSMGTWMTIYLINETELTVASVGEEVIETLPVGLKEIGFVDFGISGGIYEKGTTKGEYGGKSLDGTIFSGKVTFSEAGESYLMFGGKEAWGGFGISTIQDSETGAKVLRLYDTNGDKKGMKFNVYYFDSEVAGVPLIGEELDLKVSLEYVDKDGDDAKDDVKVGVWFNDTLYDNKYIYLNSFVNTSYSMGNWLTVYVTNGAELAVDSDATVNN